MARVFVCMKKGLQKWGPLEYSGINLKLFYIYSVQSFLSFLQFKLNRITFRNLVNKTCHVDEVLGV